MATQPAKYPRHEVAPALQAMLLDWMDRTADWDQGGDAGVQVVFVYEDRVRVVPLPPAARADSPRMVVKNLADIMEASRRTGELVPKPKDLVGVGALLEFWSLDLPPGPERDEWRKRDSSEHPMAIETRMLIVHQPGYPPVTARHERDLRGTGRKLAYPIPMMCEEPMVPGAHPMGLLIHLERLARAVLAPPPTFLSGR